MNDDDIDVSRIGADFQRHTKYLREKMHTFSLSWEEQVPLYKKYQGVKTVELPDPKFSGGAPLWKVIASRRSYRDFNNKPIGFKILSQLLWASSGITARTANYQFRSAPSAGALYPVETYMVCNQVKGIEQGLYHYDILSHKLEFLKAGNLGEELMIAGLGQSMLSDCAVSFVWSAIIRRASWKYHQRAYRYIYLDAGHIAQNLCLAAESMGLGSCLVGAFLDEEVNRLLGLDGEEETVIYMCAVGPR